MLPAPPGAINPYLSTFQGNGLSFGSNVAPWAAGWSGPDMGYNEPGLPVSSLPSGMTQVSAAYGAGAGSGNTGYGGNDNAKSGGFDPVGAGTPSAAALATLSSMRPTNLSGVTVSAYTPSLPPMGAIGGSPGGGVTNLPAVPVSAFQPAIGGLPDLLKNGTNGLQVNGADVTNLAPVQVQAPALSSGGPIQTLANIKTDHPILYQLGNMALNVATGGLTTLPSMVVNAMVDKANGKSVVDSLLPFGLNLHDVGSLLGSGGNASSTDATNSLQSLLASQSQAPIGSSSGVGGQVPGSSLITGGPLPDYAALHALGNFGSAPVGGYWNQQALKMANPAYGPYAGYGASTPQPINYANPYAPSGITSAGY